MTTELKYDPELPFALVRTKADGEAYPLGVVEARTRLREDANDLADTYEGGWVTVIDTTPKPKIPEDAEYLIWERDGETTMAFADGGEWFGNGCYWMSTEDILEEIGDAEVTVLVRKEES